MFKSCTLLVLLVCFFCSLIGAWDPSWSKVGLAWPDGNSDNLWALAGNGWNKVAWIYTWSPWNVDAATQANLDFVPMLWGSDASDFEKALSAGVFDKSTCVLGFNEPDNSGQSNLSPGEAVSLWNQYIQPLKSRGLRLGAPAVTSAPSGKAWLSQFLSQCSGCDTIKKIDFIPIHWYGSDPNAFAAYVTDIHNSFGKNIWVTEWACVPYTNPPCDQQSVYNFMGATTYFLDSNSWLERYFGAMRNLGDVPATNALLTPDGQNNTALGVQYAKGGCSAAIC